MTEKRLTDYDKLYSPQMVVTANTTKIQQTDYEGSQLNKWETQNLGN